MIRCRDHWTLILVRFRNYEEFHYNNVLLSFLPLEVPKKALLQKIQLLRKERQAGKTREDNLSFEQSQADYNYNHEATKPQIDDNIKRKLIMKTIEDIKRSLEDQSLELNELHDSDN